MENHLRAKMKTRANGNLTFFPTEKEMAIISSLYKHETACSKN